MSYFPTSSHGDTVVVTLNNPDRNTLLPELLEEGTKVFEQLVKDPPKGGVVLTGAGEHFTCGMNTKVAASLDEAGVKRAVAAINSYCAALHRLPCSLVAAVNGNCIGAGGIMALASDWIVAAKGDYKIGLPEAKAGLPFPPVPQIILDYWMDPVWRRRLALSSELLAPEQAILAGLADELCDTAKLIETAVAQAQTLNAQPGFAACKQQLRARANAEIDAILA
ncbi:enoyl-CoA hydratase/isomerase family protein [Alterisphingorhabdus coralli]|uniref:Enoyl-CoA hydratase/isomerase family protein n=1 Tax=Alterisphingorhabdus coralli TaxID=3071408 RepID=A0AA97I1S2_9SPHN|nr:enoyl-CoA hydratase/isomerase family protein [Parasphingorhabdus sp. SCSIO 66989]WOE75585.1 enoyl-CoA hydratase/isomerase family protein [Parasphingorhabdus sp. SCSIO 66989]